MYFFGAPFSVPILEKISHFAEVRSMCSTRFFTQYPVVFEVFFLFLVFGSVDLFICLYYSLYIIFGVEGIYILPKFKNVINFPPWIVIFSWLLNSCQLNVFHYLFSSQTQLMCLYLIMQSFVTHRISIRPSNPDCYARNCNFWVLFLSSFF